MGKKYILSSLIFSSLLAIAAPCIYAQDNDKPANGAHAKDMIMMGGQSPDIKKVYMTTGFDGNILSSSFMSKSGGDSKMTTPRYTMFFHIGVNFHYNFSKSFGMFTGVGIKNIGFIEKFDAPDSTVKRRVYAIGIPVGIKIGNMTEGSYLMLGGGIDMPFNYKEKGFVKRSDKTKFNEWFSQRTPAVMPYVFIGTRLRPGFMLKLQYYPTNFLNQDFEVNEGGVTSKPYNAYDVKLVTLSFGFNIPYRPKW